MSGDQTTEPSAIVSHDLGIAYPGIAPRLVSGGSQAEDFGAYRSRGGYRPLPDAEAFVREVEESGLRGRGGAAFPAGRKLRTVRAGEGVPVVVANGEEGEPASVKDRWLMRHRPHLVLDGLRLAARATGTNDAHVFVSDPGSEQSIRFALKAARRDPSFDIAVSSRVAPAYVAGEETAVVQALNGGPALPTDKPPRPFQAGVGGRPTLVANVETLANLPWVQRLGAAGYRAVGTEKAPGTFLMTLTIRGRAGLYEVPFGTTLRDVLTWLDEDVSSVGGFLVGGYFAGVVGEHALDVPLEYDTFADLGSGLGCGAVVVVLGRDDCSVATTAAVNRRPSRCCPSRDRERRHGENQARPDAVRWVRHVRVVRPGDVLDR